MLVLNHLSANSFDLIEIHKKTYWRIIKQF